MSATVRSASSILLKLVGYAAAVGGLALGAAALMADAGELQVYVGVIALGGFLIALVGGAVIAIGALLARGLPKSAGPSLSPEEQQLRDSQAFLARRSKEERR
jgi:hypothetical protein